LQAECDRLRRELRLLRLDHETLIASTDVREELRGLYEKNYEEVVFLRE
jgi:hypothetical protein